MVRCSNLGKLKGSQRNQIHPASRTIYEDESITISYDDFTRIATANNVTIMIGKRKFDLSSAQIRLLSEFHKLMQREGQKTKTHVLTAAYCGVSGSRKVTSWQGFTSIAVFAASAARRNEDRVCAPSGNRILLTSCRVSSLPAWANIQ